MKRVLISLLLIPSFSAHAELSENQRKAIYSELKAASHRAFVESEVRYPIDATHIPAKKLAAYDWKSAISNHANEENALNAKYENKVLKKQGISAATAREIATEAIEKGWGVDEQ